MSASATQGGHKYSLGGATVPSYACNTEQQCTKLSVYHKFITINDFDEIPKYLLVLPNISILLVLQDTALITHGTE